MFCSYPGFPSKNPLNYYCNYDTVSVGITIRLLTDALQTFGNLLQPDHDTGLYLDGLLHSKLTSF